MATEFLTRRATAKRLGISERHVSRLKDDGVLTVLELEGERWPKYPWPTVEEEWKEYQAKLQGDDVGESEDEILARARMDPRRRQELAKARIAELDLLEKMGELMPREVHRRVVGELLDLLQAQVTAIPGRWSADLIGLRNRKEATQVLRELKDELLDDVRNAVSEGLRRNGKRPE